MNRLLAALVATLLLAVPTFAYGARSDDDRRGGPERGQRADDDDGRDRDRGDDRGRDDDRDRDRDDDDDRDDDRDRDDDHDRGGRGADRLDIVPIGRTAPIGEGGAEIGAFDPRTDRAFATNAAANALDVYDLRNPRTPTLLRRIDLSPYGGGPNSVDVSRDGLVAVAVEAQEATDPGSVQFFDADGDRLCEAPAGALPDMVTFTDSQRELLVANEGEPADDGSVDPEGSVTIVQVKQRRRGGDCDTTTRTAGFRGVPLRGPVRIFGPGATKERNLEPEYIATSGDRAWVTIQEANAIGLLDVKRGRFTEVRSLGFKDHSRRSNALDPSDRDGGINIGPWDNLLGMYQPDAIAAYRDRGRTRLVTVNEGDARDYAFFSEEERAGDLPLDPEAFPNGEGSDDKLGRLNVTTTLGDDDGDGDYDRLVAFGARSLSVLDDRGRITSDTGSLFESFTAAFAPETFNLDNSADSPPDDRSDNKGPEPEAVDTGDVGGTTYAFAGAERQGGIFALDLDADPGAARLAGYVNTRPQDLGPEGAEFVDAKESPTRRPLLLVTSEISGTLTVFELREQRRRR